MFLEFVDHLTEALNETLPGESAQRLMAPPHRVSTEEYLRLNRNAKKSSVLILFYPKNNIPHLALILRNEYKGVHSGQVSFPGGKIEEKDASPEATALRETREEIGIDAPNITIIGKLTKLYIPVSNFWVYPFVGMLSYSPIFNIDVKEVKQLIEVPIKEILSENIISTAYIKLKDDIKIKVPVFNLQEHIIWGATAMMLSELREILFKAKIL
jgi:8-oxo-dGTP pyrophosphatase MutT (NUDIX family)